MKRAKRTDTITTAAAPLRLLRIFKPRQHRADDSAFFCGGAGIEDGPEAGHT